MRSTWPRFFSFCAKAFLHRIASRLQLSGDRRAALFGLFGELESATPVASMTAAEVMKRAAVEIFGDEHPILAERVAALKTDSPDCVEVWISCAAEAVVLQGRSAAITEVVGRWPDAARDLLAASVDEMKASGREAWGAFDAVEESIIAPDDTLPRPLPRFDAACLRWLSAIGAVEAIVQTAELTTRSVATRGGACSSP